MTHGPIKPGCHCSLCLAGEPPLPRAVDNRCVQLVALTLGQIRGLVVAVDAAQGIAGYAPAADHHLDRSLEQLRALLPETR